MCSGCISLPFINLLSVFYQVNSDCNCNVKGTPCHSQLLSLSKLDESSTSSAGQVFSVRHNGWMKLSQGMVRNSI